METISLAVVVVLLVLIARESRAGARALAAEPDAVRLEPRQRFRTLRMQTMEPMIAVVVVGSLLVTDLERAPVHALMAFGGAVAGYFFGAYRARVAYVAAIPRLRGVVLRYSIESVLALVALLVIKLVAERDVLPENGLFHLVVAGLLGFLLAESVARLVTLLRLYRRDADALAPA